jgi:hypothetical protein
LRRLGQLSGFGRSVCCVCSSGELHGPTSIDHENLLQLLARVLDGSEFLEFRQMYGEGLVCGYGRIGGYAQTAHHCRAIRNWCLFSQTIGVVAAVGTGIDAKAALKACQLVQTCDDRTIPLVFFQRCLHDGWSQYDSCKFLSCSTFCSDSLSFF